MLMLSVAVIFSVGSFKKFSRLRLAASRCVQYREYRAVARILIACLSVYHILQRGPVGGTCILDRCTRAKWPVCRP